MTAKPVQPHDPTTRGSGRSLTRTTPTDTPTTRAGRHGQSRRRIDLPLNLGASARRAENLPAPTVLRLQIFRFGEADESNRLRPRRRSVVLDRDGMHDWFEPSCGIGAPSDVVADQPLVALDKAVKFGGNHESELAVVTVVLSSPARMVEQATLVLPRQGRAAITSVANERYSCPATSDPSGSATFRRNRNPVRWQHVVQQLRAHPAVLGHPTPFGELSFGVAVVDPQFASMKASAARASVLLRAL